MRTTNLRSQCVVAIMAGFIWVALCTADVPAANVLAGVWSSGGDSNYFSIDMDLASLTALAEERHKKGLRLDDLETYTAGGQRKWAGVWRSGSGGNYFSVDKDLAAFTTLAEERHKKGLRLVDLETYVAGGQRKWAGVWRSGDGGNYFSVDKDIAAFTALAEERHKKGLRLVDLETYEAGGQRKWAGVWRSGTHSNYFSVAKDLAAFTALAEERHKENLRLTDVETYEEGGQRKWAGIWRSGSDANYFSVGKYVESFVPLAEKRHKEGLRLVDLEIYESECGDVYSLPFDDDSDWILSNGNWDDPKNGHGKGNPKGLQAFAFDFVHDSDGAVRAARGGTVYALVESESGNSWGSGTPPGYKGVGNFLVIDHGDGTFGTYWHLKMNGVLVNLGQKVSRGDKIALSGNTGNSSAPHLHFDVRTGWSLGYPADKTEFPSVKIRFRDKNHGCWRPRVGDSLESDNK